MKKWSCAILGILVLSAAGCSVFDDDNGISFSMEFWMTGRDGSDTTKFENGEKIYFHFKVTNDSCCPREWNLPDSRPYANFYVYQGNALIGPAWDGPVIYIPRSGTLQPDESLVFEMTWVDETGSHNQNTPLPAGQYRAVCHSDVDFEDIEPLKDSKLDFSVAP
ncbi:hypothetical protein JXA40_02075 [bacterium]|nr:hypothetical protein [candidate division CSSED10-310 bacterium]